MKLHIIETGNFKLDGGAMFGVVPKRMWQKLNPPDDENLCTWAMRCLLIEEGNQKILIDTGVGNKQDDKFRRHFYPHNDKNFDELLSPLGLSTSDITDVIITHFHFDHVGGAVQKDSRGNLIPTFPNATYWSNELHYNWALNPNPREQASFLKENFVPLQEHGVLKFLDIQQNLPFNDFIRLRFVYGHTHAMMLPIVKLPSGNTLVYTADLIPSRHHIAMPYIMAYDIRPLDTMKEKAELFESMDESHYLFFEHDNEIACGSVVKGVGNRFSFGEDVVVSKII